MAKYGVTFYTKVVYPTANDVEQDQFTRFYEAISEEEAAHYAEYELEKSCFLKDMKRGSRFTWYYKTDDVTSYRIEKIEEDK